MRKHRARNLYSPDGNYQLLSCRMMDIEKNMKKLVSTGGDSPGMTQKF